MSGSKIKEMFKEQLNRNIVTMNWLTNKDNRIESNLE